MLLLVQRQASKVRRRRFPEQGAHQSGWGAGNPPGGPAGEEKIDTADGKAPLVPGCAAPHVMARVRVTPRRLLAAGSLRRPDTRLHAPEGTGMWPVPQGLEQNFKRIMNRGNNTRYLRTGRLAGGNSQETAAPPVASPLCPHRRRSSWNSVQLPAAAVDSTNDGGASAAAPVAEAAPAAEQPADAAPDGSQPAGQAPAATARPRRPRKTAAEKAAEAATPGRAADEAAPLRRLAAAGAGEPAANPAAGRPPRPPPPQGPDRRGRARPPREGRQAEARKAALQEGTDLRRMPRRRRHAGEPLRTAWPDSACRPMPRPRPGPPASVAAASSRLSSPSMPTASWRPKARRSPPKSRPAAVVPPPQRGPAAAARRRPPRQPQPN